MPFLTRWFGVTESDAERDLAREEADIEEIAEKILLMQNKCRYTSASLARSRNSRKGRLRASTVRSV